MVAVAQAQTYTPLNAPYVSTDEIIAALRTVIPQRWNVPIYDEFPSVTENVRYGLYVSDVIVAQRNAVSLGLTFCGAIYNAVDTFTVVYISFQQDPYEQQIANIVSDLITLQVNGVPVFGSYVSNTFTQDLSYGPTRAAIHTWTFQMIRPEFNT